MSKPRLGVAAAGDDLVDILAPITDEELKNLGFEKEKGVMTLIDEETADSIYKKMKNPTIASGGSAANTMVGYASFGGKGAFIGKVADDELGKAFRDDTASLNISFDTQPLVMGPGTGRCMIFVTPDAQRTMLTYLGAAIELSADDIDTNLIADAQITYLEGYLFDPKNAKSAFVKAAEAAHEAGHRVALTLSDPFCVDRHRSDFLRLVENHIDILFANEDEIKSLFMQDKFEDAQAAISDHVEIAILTRSEKGAVIVADGKEVKIDAAPVDKVIDTTGAGDQFAAGFLYGFTSGFSLEESGRLGALAASEVISHMGPRPKIDLSTLIDKARAA